MAQGQFADLVKAVVDTQRRIMVIGGELHSDEESYLLDKGSNQSDLWGINLYPGSYGDADWLEFDSMINLRPRQGNRSRGVETHRPAKRSPTLSPSSSTAMPEPHHAGLAAGRWHTLTIAEQMGNIGSEVSRALRANTAGNQTRMWAALERALELFDLTTNDPRWTSNRKKEIRRAREVTCDYLAGDNQYGTTAESLDRYFLAFAVLARKAK